METTTAPGLRRRRPKRASSASGASSEQYFSKAIGRALDILDCFSDEQTVLSLKEIGRLVEMPESSLFRILVTLEGRGYLSQNRDGSYQLTPKVLFGKLHERAQAVRDVARPFLERLAGLFDETASLAYLFEDKIQVLDTVESLHVIKFTNRPGRVLPPHCSSLGKAITAFQPQEKIEQILESYGLFRRTGKTIVDRRRLLAELEEVRRTGYACDREESVIGGVCLGAAITAGGSPVVSALSVSIPVVRLTDAREREIIAAVLDAAREAAMALQERRDRPPDRRA